MPKQIDDQSGNGPQAEEKPQGQRPLQPDISHQDQGPPVTPIGSKYVEQLSSIQKRYDRDPPYVKDRKVHEITPNLYLSSIYSVPKHILEKHGDSPVLVINAYATSVPDPLNTSATEIASSIKYNLNGASLDQVEDFPSDPLDIKDIRVEHQSLRNGTEILNIQMYDSGGVPIEKIFHYIADTINEARVRENPLPVYVACQQGISRSPTLLGAYFVKHNPEALMVEGKLSPLFPEMEPMSMLSKTDDAEYFLRSLRAVVCPNMIFSLKLQTFSDTCQRARAAVSEGSSVSEPATVLAPRAAPAGGSSDKDLPSPPSPRPK